MICYIYIHSICIYIITLSGDDQEKSKNTFKADHGSHKSDLTTWNMTLQALGIQWIIWSSEINIFLGVLFNNWLVSSLSILT